jgi:hypothetical protein
MSSKVSSASDENNFDALLRRRDDALVDCHVKVTD